MKKTDFYILDTNTLISAIILPNSVARKAFDKARKSGQIIVSKETLDELNGVLVRPKFDKYIPLDLRLEIIEEFESVVKHISPKYTITDCRDEKDNKFLELALTVKAKAIITGDKDLLTLNPYHDILIINANGFLLIN
ncbi:MULTISPECIES: putative toxin-antitoxin system toxin component, PIN family [Olivibacter]|jgi:putative PIN family toxin of toxin-antitoxin system|uniref:Toxin-antitoxin system toxin component, PIN family n=1 Tax=Olivibacter oleidegradans TaxID=760123 RepID=A0ABV6HHA9_9SPHI|nr:MULTISPECIES: putative toxin-antitoxin system toxin component, PIN family [Olivibacter]QEL00434.1 putative toxin-antitoxin system toxin component, PIN family [Olivibacter sp. LS-1]